MILNSISSIIHCTFILVTVSGICLARFRSNIQSTWRKKFITSRYACHETRWILTLVFITILVFQILEGILLSLKSGIVRADTHADNVLGLIAAIASLMFYNFAERTERSRCLLFILAYWCLTSLVKAVKLYVLVERSLQHCVFTAQLLMASLVVICCSILVILDFFVFLKEDSQGYCCHRRPQTSLADDEIDCKFLHSYSSFISKVLFNWLNDVMLLGFRKPLEVEDLGTVPPLESTETNFKKLKATFEQETKLSYRENRNVSLWRCFWRLSKRMLLLSGSFKLLSDLFVFVPPLCLTAIVTFALKENDPPIPSRSNSSIEIPSSVNDSEYDNTNQTVVISIEEYFSNGYVLSFIAFFAFILEVVLYQNHLFIVNREGIRLKCAVQAFVFDKSLRLMSSSVNEGQIMNHMTVDALQLIYFSDFVHFIWTLPIAVFLGFLLLYLQLGLSALIGGLLVLLMVPVQYLLGRQLGLIQEQIMQNSDERLKKSNELLQNIRLLKLYAWERIFLKSVLSVRTKEMLQMLRASFARIIAATVTDGIPYFASLLTFTLYFTLETTPLHPGKVFSSIAIFSILANQLFFIAIVINTTSQALISVARLQSFFLMPELGKQDSPKALIQRFDSLTGSQIFESVNSDSRKNSKSFPLVHYVEVRNGNEVSHIETGPIAMLDSHSDVMISIKDGYFSWLDEEVLSGINLNISTGKLTMIVGSVGSGKSSLLWAILGEMKKVDGKIQYRSSSIAFVPQRSWILNETVRENIIFGLPFDDDKYRHVIEVCGLEPDIAMFAMQDQTEIGEKGANLSGGQKQRISIARAIYSDADIYLLDDSLSALDANVGGHIFEEAIKKHLLGRSKTVILVTHHIHLLPFADHIVIIKNGRISSQGSYGELISNEKWSTAKNRRSSILEDEIESHAGENYITADNSRKTSLVLSHIQLSKSSSLVSPGMVKSQMSLSALNINDGEVFDETVATVLPGGTDPGKLIQDEERLVGSIPLYYPLQYIKAATVPLVFSAVLCYCLRQGFRMWSDFWLTLLIDKSIEVMTGATSPNRTNYRDELSYHINIYAVLSFASIVLVPLQVFFLEISTLTASKNLHSSVLMSIISAPIQFFDSTPVGRILNRISADMNVIDSKLVSLFDYLLYCGLFVLGGVIMNCVFVPIFIVPTFPIFILYIFLQRFYVASARELQRLDCITKSPILAHLSQALAGLPVIRAFRCQEQFQLENWKRIDYNNITFLFYRTTHIWLGLRLEFIGSLIVLIACLSSIISCSLRIIEPGTVGLVIAYAVMSCFFLNWTMRGVSEMEIYFGTIQRIVKYSHIESEPYDSTDGSVVPLGWPSKGEIKFKSVTLQHGDHFDPVVHEISLEVQAGHKVGICGRTGSGKSTLTSSLFRMVNITKGVILLDDIDITKVPLMHLRSKLSIIPQDPVLFSGTIRFNLDPVEEKTDDELWYALNVAQLDTLVQSFPLRLETSVSEGGDNFSSGQRQLFCLARAILRNSKVLIMDEATASIDTETDQLIQEIVQTAFSDRTVLTIAHRLSTIQNCDRVIVLKDGHKIEEGPPDELKEKPDGAFAQMLSENQL